MDRAKSTRVAYTEFANIILSASARKEMLVRQEIDRLLGQKLVFVKGSETEALFSPVHTKDKAGGEAELCRTKGIR